MTSTRIARKGVYFPRNPVNGIVLEHKTTGSVDVGTLALL
jgi:hypothetical protein